MSPYLVAFFFGLTTLGILITVIALTWPTRPTPKNPTSRRK